MAERAEPLGTGRRGAGERGRRVPAPDVMRSVAEGRAPRRTARPVAAWRGPLSRGRSRRLSTSSSSSPARIAIVDNLGHGPGNSVIVEHGPRIASSASSTCSRVSRRSLHRPRPGAGARRCSCPWPTCADADREPEVDAERPGARGALLGRRALLISESVEGERGHRLALLARHAAGCSIPASRNRLPHAWLDVESDPDVESLLRALEGVARADAGRP